MNWRQQLDEDSGVVPIENYNFRIDFIAPNSKITKQNSWNATFQGIENVVLTQKLFKLDRLNQIYDN